MRELYHKISFFLKALRFPRVLGVGDTSAKILVHNWPAGMNIFNGSTMVRDGKMFYEPTEYQYFSELAKGKRVFFDIGSHIGWYSLLAHGLGVEKSYAFDVVDSFYKICKKNFELNKINGGVFNVAVGIPGKEADFSQSIFSGKKIAISLDNFCKERNVYPDLIKIDIEGFELDTLLNMPEILKRHPAFHLAVHPGFLKERGQSEEDIFKIFDSLGYKTIWSDGDTHFLA